MQSSENSVSLLPDKLQIDKSQILIYSIFENWICRFSFCTGEKNIRKNIIVPFVIPYYVWKD